MKLYDPNYPQPGEEPFNAPPQEMAEAWGISIDQALAPIETQYRGYRFRSRLEARWATFFDAMGMAWDYELEGYKLPSGDCYLPDFWLPVVQMWAEVKPRPLTRIEAHKCHQLSAGTRRPCLYLVGTPDTTVYWAAVHDGGIVNDVDYILDIYYHGRRLYEQQRRLFACASPWPVENFTEEYVAAVAKARSARFGRRAA